MQIKAFYIIISLLILTNTAKIEAGTNSADFGKVIDYGTEKQLISGEKQITFVGSRSGEGYFSADGSKMIYQSEREEGNPFYQMYVLDLASGKSNRISIGTGMTTCGWIHPSLKKAMWSSTHLDPLFKDKLNSELKDRANSVKKKYAWSYDEQYDIFESNLEGKNVKRLTKELGYDAEGSYSPNGKLIAFASNRSAYGPNDYSQEEKRIIEKDSSYAMDIYIMNSDGSNVKQLTHTKGYDGGPFFSADGSKITWRRFTPDGSKAEIFTMNIDGSEQQQVTQLDVMSWAPFYHPSGRYIIFTSSVLGYSNFELFIVEASGNGKPIRVSHQDGFDGLAAFSPDGKKISWTHRNEKGESQIYLADWNHELALSLIEENKKFKTNNLYLNSSINESDVNQIVKYLASDEFKGRLTGSEEEKVYTAQIAKWFQTWGLKPVIGNNLIHTFEFTSSVKAGLNNKLTFKGRYEKNLQLGVDYQLSSFSKSGEFATAPLVFVGFGIKAPATDKIGEYDSYKNLDVKDKWVVLLDYLPNPMDKEVKQHLMGYSQLQHKVSLAKNNNALGVLVVSEVGIKDLKFDGSFLESSIPVIKISTQTFSDLLKKSDYKIKTFQEIISQYESLKEKDSFALSSQYLEAKVDLIYQKSTGRNVLGVLETKNKKSRGVIIGAHGDHLGNGLSSGSSLARSNEKGQIHYGADDNASGVAGVIELAHYFSQTEQLKKLKKPLYFAIWSGEEAGVIGSSTFIKDWSHFKKQPLKSKIEASLNMDMIGRFRDKLQVQGVGSAKEWAGLSEEVSLVSGIPLTLTSDPYLPTDSMSFYLAELPAISFMTGTHEEYHSPRDTPDRINYKGLVKTIDIVRLFTEKIVTHTSSALSYIKVEGDSSKSMKGRSFRIYLGTIPDYSQEGVKGVRISGTSKNSPAEAAGLKAGDVIIEFDNLKIENLYDYVFALQSAKPNNKINVSILRENKKIELSIVPQLKE